MDLKDGWDSLVFATQTCVSEARQTQELAACWKVKVRWGRQGLLSVLRDPFFDQTLSCQCRLLRLDKPLARASSVKDSTAERADGSYSALWQHEEKQEQPSRCVTRNDMKR
jgi:hypothetical protein